MASYASLLLPQNQRISHIFCWLNIIPEMWQTCVSLLPKLFVLDHTIIWLLLPKLGNQMLTLVETF